MAKYYDADTLLEFVKKYTPNFDGETTLECVKRAILYAPTADVAEVKHGAWIQNQHCKRIYYCSECGRHIEDGSQSQKPQEFFPYCHCGAKMYIERNDT